MAQPVRPVLGHGQGHVGISGRHLGALEILRTCAVDCSLSTAGAGQKPAWAEPSRVLAFRLGSD